MCGGTLAWKPYLASETALKSAFRFNYSYADLKENGVHE